MFVDASSLCLEEKGNCGILHTLPLHVVSQEELVAG